MVKQIKCPKCVSKNFTVVVDVLLGPVGAVGRAIIGKKQV